MEISANMFKIGYKSTLEAAILDLRKVILENGQARMTLKHHAINEYEVIN